MLYCACGLARCGKSTFANWWVTNHDKRTIVSGDDIRLALTGQRYNPAAEHIVQSLKYTFIRAMLLRNFTVFHDGTNTTLNSVHNMEKLAESVNEKITWVYFNTPLDECQRRAKLHHQDDLLEAIDRMSKNIIQTKQYITQKYYGDGPIIIPASKIKQCVIRHEIDENNNVNLIMERDITAKMITKSKTNLIIVNYYS